VAEAARFITLEGGEGAGKSTQARLLARALAQTGHAVLLTREPGGAPGAEALRAMLLGGVHRWSAPAEAHLHFAARAEHLAHSILPALAAGMVVVCDRFADSTLAYQGYGQGADQELIRGLTALLPRQPDRTVMLRVSAGVAARRMAGRHQALDRYEAMDAAFHARVAGGFAEIAAAAPDRCRVVDADGGMDAVHAAIMEAVA
jgi:dTMP kinase